MASVASYVTLSVRKLSVDISRHGQHHSRGFLLWIVIAGEITLHVAEGASLAEGARKGTHSHLELLRSVAGENLQILWRSKRVGTLSTLFLGAEADGNKQQNNC